MRGDGLLLLLRRMVDDGLDQSNHNRRSRDARVIRKLAALGCAVEDFEACVREGGGLDKLSRGEPRATVPRTSETASSSASPAVEEPTTLLAAQGGPEYRTLWRDGLRRRHLIDSQRTPHDVILIGRVDPTEKTVTIRGAYETQYGRLDKEREAAIVGTLSDAGFLKASPLGRK